MKKVKVKIKRKNSSAAEKVVSAWRKEAKENTDVLGWYTGVPSENGDAQPEQDSDDL